MISIRQSHTIENLMPAEDHTIAIAIVEPQARINMGACVAGIGFDVSKKTGSGGSIHIIIDAEQGVSVPKTAHSLRRIIGENLAKLPGFQGLCQEF